MSIRMHMTKKAVQMYELAVPSYNQIFILSRQIIIKIFGMRLKFYYILLLSAYSGIAQTTRSIDLNRSPSLSASDTAQQDNHVVQFTPAANEDTHCQIHRPGCIHWKTLPKEVKNAENSKASYHGQTPEKKKSFSTKA